MEPSWAREAAKIAEDEPRKAEEMSKTAKYSPNEVQDSTRKTYDNPKRGPSQAPREPRNQLF